MRDNEISLDIVYGNASMLDESRGTFFSTESKEPIIQNRNYFASIMALVSNTVGITILMMPRMFHLSGLLLGSLQLLILAAVTLVASSMLCWAGNIFEIKSYFEIGEKVFIGKRRYITHFFFFLLLIGRILCYQVFVLESLNNTIKGVWFPGHHNSSLTLVAIRMVSCVVVNLLILPFLFSKRLKYIKLLSKICSIGIAFSICMIYGVYFFPWMIGIDFVQPEYRFIKYIDYRGLYTTQGVYMLSYCYHLIVVDVNHEIKPKTKISTNLVLISNTVISFMIYLSVSLFGYLATLEEYEDPTNLSNFFVFLIVHKKNKSYLLQAASFMIMIAVLFGNTINYLPLIRFLNWKLNKTSSALSSKLLEELNLGTSFSDYELTDEECEINYTKRYVNIVIGAFLIVLSTVMVIMVFDMRMEMIFDVVSATCAAPVCIILPVYFYFHLLGNQYFKSTSLLDYITSYSVMMLGIGIWIFSIIAVFKL